MQHGRAPSASTARLALAIAIVAIAATLLVAWMAGALRASGPRSAAIEASDEPSIAASVPPASSGAASPGPEASVTSPAPPASPAVGEPDPVLIGVGDIARCDSNGDEATARLAETHPGIVFTLGDNAYPAGSDAQFRDCYDPSWGRVRDRTAFPVPGNHDYETAGAAGYRAYFGDAATPDGTTWYSRDVGAWHVIVLDADCGEPGVGCGPSSAQVRWLRDDLAASDALCTLAMWHHPRFSSGDHGNDTGVAPFWDALYEAGADLVLNGHDHDYERFAPQDPSGRADADHGITELVVGTGGGEMRDMGSTVANSLVRRGRLLGVVELTLKPDGWTTRFISTDGTFADDAGGTCHGPLP